MQLSQFKPAEDLQSIYFLNILNFFFAVLVLPAYSFSPDRIYEQRERGKKSNNKILFQYNFCAEFILSWFMTVHAVDWTNTYENWQILFSEFIAGFFWQQKSTLFYFSSDNPVIYKILVIQAGVLLNTLVFTQNLSLICTFAYISLCVMADTVWVKPTAILGRTW